jgi:uncharacterized cupredoxin-like copper-binding protein
MSISQRRAALVAALAVLAAAILAVLLTAPPSHAAGPKPVNATLTEYKIRLTPNKDTAGKITFTAKNAGKMAHEIVIIKTPTAAGKLPVKNGLASEKGKVGELSNIAPGKTKSGTFTLQKGHYAVICNIAGHYKAGMFTDFTVS